MKKLHLMPVAAIVLALAMSAFTNQHQKIKATDPLWFYKLDVTTGENTASNYEQLTDQDQEALCPGESAVRCVIEAPDNGGVPDLSAIDRIVSMKP